MIKGSSEVARGCYSSRPISDLILEPKLRGFHQSSSSRGSSFHCWMAQIIRNQPKYVSLTHSFISHCGRGTSKFLIQIVALKTFGDIIISYQNLLFTMQRKKSPHFFQPIPSMTNFPGTIPHWFILAPLFGNHSVSVTFTQCGGQSCTWLSECRAQINHLNLQTPLGDDRARTEPSSADSKVPMVDGEIPTKQ